MSVSLCLCVLFFSLLLTSVKHPVFDFYRQETEQPGSTGAVCAGAEAGLHCYIGWPRCLDVVQTVCQMSVPRATPSVYVRALAPKI